MSGPSVVHHQQLDRAGIVASLLCAVHCGSVAIVASLGGLFHSSGLELALVAIAVVIATVAMIGGYRRHRSRAPTIAGVAAILVLVLARTSHVEAFEVVGSIVGGIGLAGAHQLNLRAGRCARGGCA